MPFSGNSACLSDFRSGRRPMGPRPCRQQPDVRASSAGEVKVQQTIETKSRSGLLHGQRDRSRLRNGAGSACDGNDVRTWCGAGVPSTSASTAITAPTATERASHEKEKQYKHSEGAPPSSPPGRNAREQEARESRAAHQWPEEPQGPVKSGGGRRSAHRERNGLGCRTA